MGKLTDKFNRLLNKVDITVLQYEKALERLQGELMKVEAELSAKLAETRDLKKMVILNEVSLETFSVEQEKLDAIQAKKSAILENIRLTTVFKTEDVEGVLEELEKERGKFAKENRQELQDMQTEMLKAKEAYLKTLVEVGERYKKVANPDRRFQDILVSKGKKSNAYYSSARETLAMISVPSGGYINLQVSEILVQDALDYGRIPEDMKRYLQKK